MGNELAVINQVDIVSYFTKPEDMDTILTKIREEATAEIQDVETVAGRKAVASTAYKVSQSKTYLEKAGKDLVADWKAKAKKVDVSRKKSRDYLDNLRDEIRQPLTEWEEAEKTKEEAERFAAEYSQAWDDAHAEHELFLRQKAIEEKEAALAREEAERIEKEEKARVEKEAKEREEQIKRDAEERAKMESEKKIEQEHKEAERKLQAEKEAREQAERDKIAAEERAIIEKEMAVKKAIEDAERKAQEEKEAAEREEAKRIAEEKKKADDKKHQAEINNIVLNTLKVNSIPEDIAKEVVILVASRKIPHLNIEY